MTARASSDDIKRCSTVSEITTPVPWNRSQPLDTVCAGLHEMTAKIGYVDEEVSAVEDYVFGLFGRRSIGIALNAVLRAAAGTGPPAKGLSNRNRRQLEEVTHFLGEALCRWALPVPTEVHRGLRGLAAFGGLEDEPAVTFEQVQPLLGRTLWSHQMVSCTIDEVVARDHFAKVEGKEPPVLASIEAAEGVDAIWVDGITSHHRYEGQRELIFGPSSAITPVDATIDTDGMVRLTCQMTQ